MGGGSHDGGPEAPPVRDTVVASSLSICLGKIATHPLDTIKAQTQVSTARASQAGGSESSSLRPGLRTVLAGSSIRSLYRGYSVAVLGSLPSGALYMTTYELLRPKLQARMGSAFGADLTAGFIAEALSCVLWCPVDVVKERLQVQAQMRGLYEYRGPVDAVRQIVQLEGVFGLYRAYGATLVAFGPFTAINLALYEQLQTRAREVYVRSLRTRAEAAGSPVPQGHAGRQPPLPAWLTFLCSSTSGLVACVVTAPLDLAKLRMQVVRAGRHGDAAAQPFNYANILDGMYKIATEEGVRGLFNGAFMRCVVWVPQVAIFLGSFKAILERL